MRDTLAVVVTQWVVWSPHTPEFLSSNPISDIIEHFSTNSNLEMTKKFEKDAMSDPSYKNEFIVP